MPYRRMTLAQAAAYLHMAEKEVERLAGHGVLPGERIKDRWVFIKQSLDDWLSANMHELAEGHLRRLEADRSSPTTAGSDALRLAGGLLREETIDLALQARTAASVLRELCRVAEATWLVYDSAALLEALRERESLCSTACPGGFALPHPRHRLPHLLGDSFVVFGRTVQPIPFGAPHGELTDLFFMILAQDDVTHLQALARLSLILRDAEIRAALRSAPGPAEALTLVREWEGKL